MVYLFLILLLLMLIINLQLTKDFFHPTIIFKMVWFISAFILIFYQERWGVSLSFETVCLFLTGFICFDLGFIFFQMIKKRNKNLLNDKNMKFRFYNGTLRTNRLLLLLLIVLIMSFYLIIDIIDVMGGLNSFLSQSFFSEYRSIRYSGTGETNSHLFIFRSLEVIGLATFIFYLREKDADLFKKILFCTIILICFAIQILTTGRMRFLSIVVQIGIIYLINGRKKGRFLNFSAQKYYLKRVGIFVLIFFMFFYFYGKFAVDKISEEDPLHSIAIYTSASLPAFDLTWRTDENTSQYFGQYLFAPIYNILNKMFGIEFGTEDEQGTKPFIRGNNGFSTNVYTLYHEQILDFGVWVVPFIMFLIGLAVAFLKYKSDTEFITGLWTGLYSMAIFSLVISFFQDTFFSNSTFTFITIFLYIVIFKTKFINATTYHSYSVTERDKLVHQQT